MAMEQIVRTLEEWIVSAHAKGLTAEYPYKRVAVEAGACAEAFQMVIETLPDTGTILLRIADAEEGIQREQRMHPPTAGPRIYQEAYYGALKQAWELIQGQIQDEKASEQA